jgi:hypothetical protein
VIAVTAASSGETPCLARAGRRIARARATERAATSVNLRHVFSVASEVAAMLNMSTSWGYREASKLGLKGYKLGRGRNFRSGSGPGSRVG